MKNGVMTLQPVQSVPVASGGTVELKLGSYHVILIGMRHDLNVGDRFEIILNFKEACAVKVEVEEKQQ